MMCDLSIEYINNRINNEICYTTINLLSDENLLFEYKKSKSVINEINIFQISILKII